MGDIPKKSLVMLVLVAAVFSVAASAITLAAIDKLDSVRDVYGTLMHSQSKAPSGTVSLYVEPRPAVKSGEVQLEVKKEGVENGRGI